MRKFKMITKIIENYRKKNKPLNEAMDIDLSHIAMINNFSKHNVRKLIDFLNSEQSNSENFELPNNLKIAAFHEGQLISALEWKSSTISVTENLVTLIDTLIMAFNQYLVFSPVIPTDFAKPYIIEFSKVFTYLQEPFNKEIKQKLNPALIEDKDYKDKVETCLKYFESYSSLCNSSMQYNDVSTCKAFQRTTNG